jgi:hypothetical protein
MATATASERWWTAQKGKASDVTFQYVRRVEQELGDVFERLFRLECLYDPNNPDAERREQDRVTENAIASNVDTVHAAIATTEILRGFDTDGGDWGSSARAKHLEWYAEDLIEGPRRPSEAAAGVQGGREEGHRPDEVHIVFDEPRVEQVLIENIVVDDAECRGGRAPRQIHEWAYIDADELAARFPKYEKEIENARARRGRTGGSGGSGP